MGRYQMYFLGLTTVMYATSISLYYIPQYDSIFYCFKSKKNNRKHDKTNKQHLFY